ncbi:hypothetical protein [Kingella oralis]|uniref:hypothetical protein n=1 Tax=Kingella oralis TaxID=505 RepID=UPI002D807A11|nr:hypothetical protein [Kingella oralis]
MPDLRINFARRRTSARLFPKKGRCVRLDVGEWVAVLNSCEGLRQPEIQSIQQKTAWLNTKRFWFSGCLCNAQRQPETLAPQQRQEWVWRRYAMFCCKLREGLRQPEKKGNKICPPPLVFASPPRFATPPASRV